MYVLAYIFLLIFGVALMDQWAREDADSDLFKKLDADMKRVFGSIAKPIDLEMARHEAQMEAINGLMCEDE